MKKVKLYLLSTISITTLALEATTNVCHEYYKDRQSRNTLIMTVAQDASELQRTKDYFSSLLNVDLLKYRMNEVAQVRSGRKMNGAAGIVINATIDRLTNQFGRVNWSTQQIIAELNEQTFKLLRDFSPDDPSDRRHDVLPPELAMAVLKSIGRHPVVGNDSKYQQKGTNIGYCFGRGCYVDLMLMRLGVDRDSIKKIWAVGPMGAPGDSITWQFHIGHMVRTPDGKWLVIDNVPGSYRILDFEAWAQFFKSQNQNGDLRLFITDSDKFTPSLGAYDPVQLGLNMSRARDWYKGYFTDLMQWFRTTSDQELAAFLGIPALPSRPEPIDPSPLQIQLSQAEEAAYSQLPPRSVRSTVQPPDGHNSRMGKIFDHFRKFGKSLGFDVDEN